MMNFIFITSFIIPLLLFPVSVNSTKSPADADSKVKAAEYGSSQIQDIEERLDNRTDDHGQDQAPMPASNWTNRRKAADSENVGDQWKPSSMSSYGSGQIQDESKKTNPNPQTTGRTTKYSNSSISGTKSSGNSGRNVAYGSGEIQPSQKKGGKSVSVESVGGGDQVSDYDDLGGNNFGQTQNGRFGNNNGIGGLNGNNNNGRRPQGIGTDYGGYGGRLGNAGGNRNGGGAGDYNDYGNGVNGIGRGGAVDPWGRGNNGGAVVPRSGNNFNNYGTDYGQGNAGGLTDYDQYDSGGGAAMPNVGSSLPRFLLLVSTSERQRFLQLEADQQRSKATIRLEKQRWVNQQLEPSVQTLYAQFTRAQQQREQQFRQRRSQLLAQQRLSATALDVDRRIQAVLNNPDVSQRTAILQVDRIMQQTNPQTRLELQQRIGVIGPLDGNFPPSQMLPIN